ncbi:MAG: PilZ domain-containing protein [Gammaproteobacteria bacterium]|nr:MAG: PilZ domain-containing protein [Gammaproteobacteria bacterium]
MAMTLTNNDERRAEARYSRTEHISLKIVFSSENPGLLGKNLDGKTVDVSASGLGLVLDRPIQVDSVLDVWVTLKDQNKKYFLTGNVRWCSELEVGGAYKIGLVLRERTDTVTDLAAWRTVFKN